MCLAVVMVGEALRIPHIFKDFSSLALEEYIFNCSQLCGFLVMYLINIGFNLSIKAIMITKMNFYMLISTAECCYVFHTTFITPMCDHYALYISYYPQPI